MFHILITAPSACKGNLKGTKDRGDSAKNDALATIFNLKILGGVCRNPSVVRVHGSKVNGGDEGKVKEHA